MAGYIFKCTSYMTQRKQVRANSTGPRTEPWGALEDKDSDDAMIYF